MPRILNVDEPVFIETSSRNFPLNDSQKAFSMGFVAKLRPNLVRICNGNAYRAVDFQIASVCSEGLRYLAASLRECNSGLCMICSLTTVAALSRAARRGGAFFAGCFSSSLQCPHPSCMSRSSVSSRASCPIFNRRSKRGAPDGYDRTNHKALDPEEKAVHTSQCESPNNFATLRKQSIISWTTLCLSDGLRPEGSGRRYTVVEVIGWKSERVADAI